MLERNQFGADERSGDRRPAACAAWAELLPDAAEGTLGDAEARALKLHTAVCASCARELADARRGAAWLEMLRGQSPEPPATMIGSILAQTIGAEARTPGDVTGVSTPGAPSSLGLPRPSIVENIPPRGIGNVRSRMNEWLGLDKVYVPAVQPRLAMTAAMAFFSVCVTFNLLGVSVQRLHAETFRPAGLQRAVAGKSASLLRSFQGIRTVYRVETRVNDWLTASAAQVEAPADSSH